LTQNYRDQKNRFSWGVDQERRTLKEPEGVLKMIVD